MNASTVDGTWIAKTSAGAVLIGRVSTAPAQLVVDRPTLGRFRDSVPARTPR